MECLVDLSEFKVVRLNSQLFPVSESEQQAYDRFKVTPVCIEASDKEILAEATNCDALLVVSEQLTEGVIDRLQRCRVISRLGAGTDKIDCEAASRNGIVITNVPDFCYEEQADHAMALLLALARRLPQSDAAMRSGAWDTGRAKCRSLHRFEGRTLGLVGFGGSAIALARRAHGFRFRMLACRRRTNLRSAEAEELNVKLTDVKTVISESDYLSLHVPLNDQTRGMFDAQRLAGMKPGSYFINTARGAIVDERALAAAIGSGHLAGAGIDVFDEISVHGPDGNPPQHPLLELENVIVTPHVAAFSIESAKTVGTRGVEHVSAILTGRWPQLEGIVNKDVTPRWPLAASSK